MILLLTIIFFGFGLIIGSFLNVVILRYHTQKSFGGRSGCMSCTHKLSWYELIPVFSYIFLRGRCSECKTKISIQYPLVEFTTGIIFGALFFKFQNIFFADTILFSLTYAYYAVLFALLLVIAVYDIRHKIIPDVMVFVFGLLAFLSLFLFSNFAFYPHLPSFVEFASGFITAFPFAFLWLISRGRWMGFGDAKLAIGLGWMLGLSLAISGIFLSFWIGAVVGVVLVIFSRKYGMRSEIPFAPYLVLGTFLAFILELHLFVF